MVEGARLERVYTGNRIEGSNPSPSAIFCSARFLKTAADAERNGRLPTRALRRTRLTPAVPWLLAETFSFSLTGSPTSLSPATLAHQEASPQR